MVTVGGIISGGLRLVRDRPVSTLIWGIVYMGVSVVGLVALLVPFMQVMIASGQNPAAADPSAAFHVIGLMYLFDFVVFIVLTILMAAGVRAVLSPDEPGFAYIRLGMDEVRLVGLMLLLVIGMFILMIVLTIVMGIVLGASGAMSGGFGQPGATPGLGFFLVMLVGFAIPTFICVRLSPALPLTMIRQKIVIGEAWRLTSGNFWKMFAGYLVLGLILFVVYIVIVFVMFIPLGAMIASGGPAFAADLMQGHVGGILPFLIGGGVVFTILSGVGIAFWAGSIAAATNELLGDSGVDYAETFA